MSETKKRAFGKRQVYRLLLFAVTLAAVIFFISRNFSQVAEYDFDFKAFYLVISLIFVACAFLARFAVWLRLAGMLGLDSPFLKAGRAYFLSVLGRYVPGKIGLALVRVEAYSSYPPERVVMATGMELVSALAAAFLLAFVGLVTSPAYFPYHLRWIALAGVAILLVLLSPPILMRTVNTIFRLLGRKQLEEALPFKTILALVGLFLIPGLLHGLGFFFVIRSLSPVSWSHYLALTGAYYAASLAGLIAIFAPGGLGVREGVLFLILPLLVPKETAIVAALIIRLVTTAAELLLTGFFSAAARVPRDK